MSLYWITDITYYDVTGDTVHKPWSKLMVIEKYVFSYNDKCNAYINLSFYKSLFEERHIHGLIKVILL